MLNGYWTPELLPVLGGFRQDRLMISSCSSFDDKMLLLIPQVQSLPAIVKQFTCDQHVAHNIVNPTLPETFGRQYAISHPEALRQSGTGGWAAQLVSKMWH